MLSSSSCTSTTWYGARSICEYCLAAPTSVEIRVVESLDLVHQQLGLDGVGQPADGALEQSPSAHASATRSSQSTSSPAATNDRRELPAAGDAVVVEPVAELVLAVGGLHRRSASGALATRSTASSCSSTSVSQQRRGSISPVGDHRQLVPHAGDPVAQRGGGPDRGRGRVVQLVGEPGRQRAEREQPLPLADDLLACCCMPRNRPSSRCTAIGNQSRDHARRSPRRGSTKNRDGR